MSTITVRDAARRLGMSVQGVTKYCSTGRLKATQKRKGTAYAIDVESLEELIAARGIEDGDAALANITMVLESLAVRVSIIEDYLASPRIEPAPAPPPPSQEGSPAHAGIDPGAYGG